MALIAGVGNPVGSTFTGTSKSLETIGKFCYAYSGEFTANTAAQTVLTFTTAGFTVVGTIRLGAFVDMGSPTTGSRAACRVKLNGTTVIDLHTDGSDKDMPFSDFADIIIPPFTKVECEVDANNTSTSVDGTVSLTGELH